MISVRFQGKPFNFTVIQVYALTSNAAKAEVEWFCEYLQDLLELTSKKDVLFIIRDWNAKKKAYTELILIIKSITTAKEEKKEKYPEPTTEKIRI